MATYSEQVKGNIITVEIGPNREFLRGNSTKMVVPSIDGVEQSIQQRLEVLTPETIEAAFPGRGELLLRVSQLTDQLAQISRQADNDKSASDLAIASLNDQVLLLQTENTALKATTPAPVTEVSLVDAIINERNRRFALGFDHDFGGERGIKRIPTTDQDMEGWHEVTTATQAAMALGLADTQLTIYTGSGPINITAIEWQQVLLHAAEVRQPIWLASFRLQSMDPIPDDLTDDKYWQN